MLPIDSAIFLWINASSATPDTVVRLALFASQQLPGWVVAGTIGAFTVGDSYVRRQAFQVLLAMAMAWAVARTGQHLIPMPRPIALGLGIQWLAHGHSAGFPSTHASVAFAFGATVARHAKNKIFATAALAVACLIAWSRICLGLHFASDVMAGAIVGLICAQTSTWAMRPIFAPRISH